jgi:hypothetical protein
VSAGLECERHTLRERRLDLLRDSPERGVEHVPGHLRRFRAPHVASDCEPEEMREVREAIAVEDEVKRILLHSKPSSRNPLWKIVEISSSGIRGTPISVVRLRTEPEPPTREAASSAMPITTIFTSPVSPARSDRISMAWANISRSFRSTFWKLSYAEDPVALRLHRLGKREQRRPLDQLDTHVLLVLQVAP